MAYPNVPDTDTMTLATLAKHKGCTVKHLKKYKEKSDKKVLALLMIHRLLTWVEQSNKASENNEIFNKKEIIETVNKWSEHRWPYNVKELKWTPAKVAATLDDNTLSEFNKLIGKEINWAQTLNRTAVEAQELSTIFNNIQ